MGQLDDIIIDAHKLHLQLNPGSNIIPSPSDLLKMYNAYVEKFELRDKIENLDLL